MTHIFTLANKLFLFSLVAAFGAQGYAEENKLGNLNVEAAQELLSKDKNVVVLDVRRPEEFALGHIEGALNINIDGEDFSKAVSQLDRDTTYVVHCTLNIVQGRMERSLKIMQDLGFKNLINMEGGIATWQQKGLPVLKGN